ncbi:MAG: glucose-6-phosphate dehydrogenase, partial [bacterium]
MSQPIQIVVLGATGDLMRRKLLPALIHLSEERAFSLVGASRSERSDEAFRKQLGEGVPEADRQAFDALADRIFYQPSDVSDPDSFEMLADRLDELSDPEATGRPFSLSLVP